MWLSEREVITKVYYVNGIKEIYDKGTYCLCIEEQEEILHTNDGINLLYNYYMFDTAYGTKMFMYGTHEKCMPNNDEIIIDYFNEYYETYINA